MSEKKLTPIHIWALGVGIVLVGEFMGWNFTILLGGSYASLIGMWVISAMYGMVVLMTTEMASVMPESGGQYTMAKYLLGPLAAFNIGLMMVLEYAMLEAADVLVVGELLQTLNPGIHTVPFVFLTLLALTYINYHGAYMSLTLNFFITAFAFCCVLSLLLGIDLSSIRGISVRLKEMTNGLPFGILGMFAALQFSCWFFLGIEGTAMAADECKSIHRALPLGSVMGLTTLMIGGTVTWFICSALIPAEVLQDSVYPLFEAADASGKPFLLFLLFAGTMMACLASANGCINDASRAWNVLSRDGLLPDVFAKIHPKYKSPYRALLFLIPISMAFALTGLLDQIVTFSIFSALILYLITAIMMIRFRKLYPLGSIKRGFTVPLHPLPAVITIVLVCATLFGMYLNYWKSMVAATVFYLISSVWFIMRRSKFVDEDTFYRSAIDTLGFPHLKD
ncbi:MAG: amino acid permease [Synergistes sp.]|nr:amino acid permease [Synergistes sp.]